MDRVLLKAEIPDKRLFRSGKCRDTFVVSRAPGRDGGSSWLLMVATDRISAFDVVLPTGIPDKGKILTQLSLWWFNRVESVCPTHVVAGDPAFCASFVSGEDVERNDLFGRCMLVKKARVIPVECIARKHLTGSAWQSYKTTGMVCGIKLPAGLREADELSVPIFTPSTKAKIGNHDENITFDQMTEITGGPMAEVLRDLTLKIFQAAYDLAKKRGILVADTKLEFGIRGGKILLVDELLTPDSSRFWSLEDFAPGGPQISFDKQYVRDWLVYIAGWNKEPPAPALPRDVVEATRKRYIEAFERLTGQKAY